MFSGIIETLGLIKNIIELSGQLKIFIEPIIFFDDLKIGDSLSVNGVCLTVTNIKNKYYEMDVIKETLSRTNLDLLSIGDPVNLERSVTINTRIGGHMVQGHVDCRGIIKNLKSDGAALIAEIKLSQNYSKYIIDKGFIAIDGMSITIIKTYQNYFTVAFIPHTKESTITKYYKAGSALNIEVDCFAKYIEKLSGVYNLCKPL